MKIDNEKKKDINLVCEHACKAQKKIHQAQFTLTGEIYKVRLIMTRLKEIAA